MDLDGDQVVPGQDVCILHAHDMDKRLRHAVNADRSQGVGCGGPCRHVHASDLDAVEVEDGAVINLGIDDANILPGLDCPCEGHCLAEPRSYVALRRQPKVNIGHRIGVSIAQNATTTLPGTVAVAWHHPRGIWKHTCVAVLPHIRALDLLRTTREGGGAGGRSAGSRAGGGG